MPAPFRAVVCAAGTALLLSLGSAGPARATPIPPGFDSTGADRQAIDALLHAYTTAVSTRNEALFESLLLNPDIPFSGTENLGPDGRDANYAAFRKGVFSGPPFTQSFRDVHVEQDGPLAAVQLVFVNRTATRRSWGWKTLQLLKTGGRWKIASEFYTGHALP